MEKDKVWVVTSGPIIRGRSLKELEIKRLSAQINLFLEHMNTILEKTPKKVGKFKFVEFEVYAEITAKGTLSILGAGGEFGSTGGLKFLFRREPTSETEE